MIVPRFTSFTENFVIRSNQITKMFRSGHDCVSTSLARSPCSFWSSSISMLSRTINAVHNCDPRLGVVLKQRRNLNFNTTLFVTTADFNILDWADPRILENPSSHTSLFLVSRHRVLSASISLVLLLLQEYSSIVLVQQASNPHLNTIWIISGLLTIARIFARILAVGFSTAAHW